MKKIIRAKTFETNSSSSHSISIVNKTEMPDNDFPRNSKDKFILISLDPAETPNDFMSLSYLFKSEVGKAGYLLNVIASYISEEEDIWEIDERTFLESKQAKWFREMLIEATNTNIVFDFTYCNVYDGNACISRIFECKWEDEISFKEYMKNLVFNKDLYIKDIESSYDLDIELTTKEY